MATVPPDAAQTPKTQDVGEADPKAFFLMISTEADRGGLREVRVRSIAILDGRCISKEGVEKEEPRKESERIS